MPDVKFTCYYVLSDSKNQIKYIKKLKHYSGFSQTSYIHVNGKEVIGFYDKIHYTEVFLPKEITSMLESTDKESKGLGVELAYTFYNQVQKENHGHIVE